MSDFENMGVTLGYSENNPIERKIDQMTGFSNMLDREDNRHIASMRGSYSQENEIRNTPENKKSSRFSSNMETLRGEMNFKISQEIGSLLNGVNSQIESAISTGISERVILQMQDVVEAVLARQFRRTHNSETDVRNLNDNNLTNMNFHSHHNLMKPEEEGPYMVTRDFESQTSVPEFLTERIHTQVRNT